MNSVMELSETEVDLIESELDEHKGVKEFKVNRSVILVNNETFTQVNDLVDYVSTLQYQ